MTISMSISFMSLIIIGKILMGMDNLFSKKIIISRLRINRFS